MYDRTGIGIVGKKDASTGIGIKKIPVPVLA